MINKRTLDILKMQLIEENKKEINLFFYDRKITDEKKEILFAASVKLQNEIIDSYILLVLKESRA